MHGIHLHLALATMGFIDILALAISAVALLIVGLAVYQIWIEQHFVRHYDSSFLFSSSMSVSVLHNCDNCDNHGTSRLPC
jgi:hypothetical protein